MMSFVVRCSCVALPRCRPACCRPACCRGGLYRVGASLSSEHPSMPLVRAAHLHDLLVPSDYAQNEQHHPAIEIQPPPVPRRKASDERAWPSTRPSGVHASADQAVRREGRRASEQERLRGEAAAEVTADWQEATEEILEIRASRKEEETWSLAAVRTGELPALLPALRGSELRVGLSEKTRQTDRTTSEEALSERPRERKLPALRGQPTRRAASAGVSLSRMATGSLRLQVCSPGK